MRRWKCTAEPRSAKDGHCNVERGEGIARQCGANATAQHRGDWRRMGKETNGSAKDRQRTDTQRHWVARPGPATNSYGDAEQCDAGQRRSKAAACNGDGLIRAAKALH
nr:MAG TPA: hypothetical protein [Caudoviricetes sp.]